MKFERADLRVRPLFFCARRCRPLYPTFTGVLDRRHWAPIRPADRRRVRPLVSPAPTMGVAHTETGPTSASTQPRLRGSRRLRAASWRALDIVDCVACFQVTEGDLLLPLPRSSVRRQGTSRPSPSARAGEGIDARSPHHVPSRPGAVQRPARIDVRARRAQQRTSSRSPWRPRRAMDARAERHPLRRARSLRHWERSS